MHRKVDKQRSLYRKNYKGSPVKGNLKDLERQNTAEFPYYWDVAKSERILEYAETLTIGEGFEKKPVQLLGFQISIWVACLVGIMKRQKKI